MNNDNTSIEQVVENYFSKYPEHINAYENAINSRNVSPYELAALGQRLEVFERYQQVQESVGNLSGLGLIPQVALDVITASSAASIIPLVASVQNVPDEESIVWFKRIAAVTPGAGYNAGDIISDPRNLDALGTDGTYGNQAASIDTPTVAGTTSYTVNVTMLPIRKFGLEIYLVGGQVWGKDDGKGNILGVGVQGSVNYTTGVVTIDFIADPGVSQFTIIAQMDVDQANELTTITADMEAMPVRTHIRALSAEIGTFSSMAFANRFGGTGTGADEVAETLASELTRALNTRAIKALNAAATGSVTWSATAPSGVSYAEHQLTFMPLGFAEAESNLHANSGATSLDVMIAGRTAAAKLRGMPQFEALPVGSTSNSIAHYGTFDGVPVVRATGAMADNEIVCLSKGDNYWNAPAVHAVFMPLLVTDTVASQSNPFKSRKAAGTWDEIKVVNKGMITKLVIG